MGVPWLNESSNFYVTTPVMEGLEDLLVSDLFILGTRHWDRDLIQHAFNPRDAAAILSTPITP